MHVKNVTNQKSKTIYNISWVALSIFLASYVVMQLYFSGQLHRSILSLLIFDVKSKTVCVLVGTCGKGLKFSLVLFKDSAFLFGFLTMSYYFLDSSNLNRFNCAQH